MRHYTSQHKRRQDNSLRSNASHISFSAFTFVDNVTNNKMILGEAEKKYQKHHRHNSTQILHKKKEVNKLNSCISLLKTTKMFQMDSLRNKLFRSAHHTRQPSLESEQEILSTKRGLQKILENTISDLSRKELDEWLVGTKKHIDPKIMGLQNLSGLKLNRTNLLHLINRQETVSQTPKVITKDKENQPVELKGEHQLRQKIEHNIAALRANNTFLVKPDNKHELYEKLYTACSLKRTPKIKKTIHSKLHLSDNSEGVFRPIKAGDKAELMEAKILQKKRKIVKPEEEREIIHAVENNLFFGLEFILNTNKGLIHSKDKKGNNLLHIAIKNRNMQFFHFLLKKAGAQSLQAKNNLGKTPLDIAKLYGVFEIVHAIQNYSPFG